jgi:hypothetical protein
LCVAGGIAKGYAAVAGAPLHKGGAAVSADASHLSTAALNYAGGRVKRLLPHGMARNAAPMPSRVSHVRVNASALIVRQVLPSGHVGIGEADPRRRSRVRLLVQHGPHRAAAAGAGGPQGRALVVDTPRAAGEAAEDEAARAAASRRDHPALARGERGARLGAWMESHAHR